MYQNETDTQRDLYELMQDGRVLAFVDSAGETIFIATEHALNIPHGAKRLSARECAERNQWAWINEQN